MSCFANNQTETPAVTKPPPLAEEIKKKLTAGLTKRDQIQVV